MDPWPLVAEAFVVGLHVLGGGVWIGAMVFSIFVLHPRADRYFRNDADFEDFIFTVVHGARWKVATGILVIGGSGGALAMWPGHEVVAATGSVGSVAWIAIFAAKLVLFCVAAGSFAYVSWVLWPRRTFASETELPALKRHFFRVGVVMVVSNTLNMALGIGAHVLRALV